MKLTALAIIFLGTLCFFGAKAWNGEEVFVPGMNELINQVRPVPNEAQEGKSSEEVEEVTETEEDDSFNEEILEAQRAALEGAAKVLNAFKTANGQYFLVDSGEKYDAFAKALVPFSRLTQEATKTLLEEKAGKKSLPLFFSIQINVDVKDIGGGVSQLVPKMTVSAVKTREEVSPLPNEDPTRLTVGQVLGSGGTDFETLDDFVKAYEVHLTIPNLKGGDSPLKIRTRLEAKIKHDLRFFGAQINWRPIVVQLTWAYASETSAEHTPNLLFLPYHVEWQVSTRRSDRKARAEFATAAGIDPERLEAEVVSFAEKNRREGSVWITYLPSTDTLSLSKARTMTVISTLVENDELKWEFDQVSGYLLTPGSGLMHLVQKMYEDLKVTELPKRIVRKELYSKSGGKPPVVMYEHEVTAFPIEKREMVSVAIEDLLDQGPSELYLFGCKQTREEIQGLYTAYEKSQESPLPCEVVFNHLTQRVVGFQKPAPAEPKTPTEYLLKKLTEESLNELKERVKKDHGIEMPGTLKNYREGLKAAIKDATFNASLDEEGSIKGAAFLFVVKDNRVSQHLVEPNELKE